MISALARPTAVLAENVGRNGEETLRAIEETGAHDMGGDALSGKVQHMKEAGILDATTMLTASIRLASLFTKEFLETGSWDVSR